MPPRKLDGFHRWASSVLCSIPSRGKTVRSEIVAYGKPSAPPVADTQRCIRLDNMLQSPGTVGAFDIQVLSIAWLHSTFGPASKSSNQAPGSCMQKNTAGESVSAQ